jgi:ribosomal protein L11 methyltransferase
MMPYSIGGKRRGSFSPVFVRQKKSPSYITVAFETIAAIADEAAGILVAHGAIGCEVRKIPLAESRRRKRKAVRLHAYFKSLTPAMLKRIGTMLKGAGMLAGDGELLIRRIDDPGWATMWQARFEPFMIGARFQIVPPWKREYAAHRTQIVIEPGQAFGTGHHASTRGTLLAIEGLCDGHGIARALDVGTGSGILAIAMRKLGVDDVTAIDIDATALENARENANLNRLDGAIRFSAAPIGSIRGRFDLITANILSSVLIEMAPQLKARLSAGGYLILAGILSREADSVLAAYQPDLSLVASRADRSWTALVLRR